MNIFITGASGYLGHDVVRSLSKKNNLILLSHRSIPQISKSKKVKIIKGDIEKTSLWKKHLQNVDVIIHLAGVTHSQNAFLYRRINTYGTIQLVDAARGNNIKQFIYISTRAIGKKCGEYGESKKLAEDYLKKSKLNYTILRVAEAYDESFKTREGLGNLAKLINKSPIVLYPSSKNITLSPIFKDDVTRSIINAVGNKNAINKSYVVAGSENLTFKEIEQRISNHLKKKRIFIPMPVIALNLAFLVSSAIGFSKSDQLKRLTGKKEPMSQNLKDDLDIRPRKFLRSYSE